MVWWVRSDPCGLFSANLTIALILYAQFVIVKILVLPWFGFGIHVLLYTVCSILALLSHTRAQFSDPGAVPKSFLPVKPSLKKGEITIDDTTHDVVDPS